MVCRLWLLSLMEEGMDLIFRLLHALCKICMWSFTLHSVFWAENIPKSDRVCIRKDIWWWLMLQRLDASSGFGSCSWDNFVHDWDRVYLDLGCWLQTWGRGLDANSIYRVAEFFVSCRAFATTEAGRREHIMAHCLAESTLSSLCPTTWLFYIWWAHVWRDRLTDTARLQSVTEEETARSAPIIRLSSVRPLIIKKIIVETQRSVRWVFIHCGTTQ